jgi:hypothetical protein
MARRKKKGPPGKIKSRRQQGFLFARYPRAARKWAHRRRTDKGDWKGR